jgi:hypothetical protein
LPLHVKIDFLYQHEKDTTDIDLFLTQQLAMLHNGVRAASKCTLVLTAKQLAMFHNRVRAASKCMFVLSAKTSSLQKQTQLYQLINEKNGELFAFKMFRDFISWC